MSITKQTLAFVDIETTGGSPADSRVLEVGVILVRNNQVIQTYETLLNPIGYVPPAIEWLTGITTEMVQWAPVFAEVAPRLIQLFEKAIFIAHNVNFDYQFLASEFAQLGHVLQMPKLCTVKLSRTLFPMYPRHNLDSLIARHELDANGRHRAMADAWAIWQFYGLCLQEFDIDTIERAWTRQHTSIK